MEGWPSLCLQSVKIHETSENHEKKMNIRNFQVAHNFINPTFLRKGNQRNLKQLMQRKWHHKQFWFIPVVHQMNQSMMTVPLAENLVISQMALIAINQSRNPSLMLLWRFYSHYWWDFFSRRSTLLYPQKRNKCLHHVIWGMASTD